MPAASWEEVKAETVSNWTVKAQIPKVTQEVPSNPPDALEAWNALHGNIWWSAGRHRTE